MLPQSLCTQNLDVNSSSADVKMALWVVSIRIKKLVCFTLKWLKWLSIRTLRRKREVYSMLSLSFSIGVKKNNTINILIPLLYLKSIFLSIFLPVDVLLQLYFPLELNINYLSSLNKGHLCPWRWQPLDMADVMIHLKLFCKLYIIIFQMMHCVCWNSD